MKISRELKYGLYILFHPFDGFYDLKHEKRGSLKSSLILFSLFVISSIVKRQLTGYLFNPYNITSLNYVTEIILTAAPFVLLCVSNWCVTSLSDGEGRFIDILIAVGYSLTPITIINFLSIIVSRVITLEEISVYVLLTSIGIIWAYSLIFLGLMITHQYTVLKSFWVAILTLAGMAIILFISFLFFYLIQQLVNFISEVWIEASFRLNEK